MKRTKVTYIISNIHKSLSFEWIVKAIDHEKIDLSFILVNVKQDVFLQKFIESNGYEYDFIYYSSKKNLIPACIKIFTILIKKKPDVIHAHLFEAGLIGLIAGRMAGVRSRIYTRHYSTFHSKYFKSAVKYDKLISSLATDLIAISENTKKVLEKDEQVNPSKIHLLHHGFDLDYFNSADPKQILALKDKYQLPKDAFPVIGVISRFTELKGHRYIIEAFKEVLKVHSHAHLILANAVGDYAGQINLMLSELPSNNYTKIAFEDSLNSLYKLFHIFIHVPIDAEIEAFGQTYVEALAVGVPGIFTLSGVAKEFIVDKENALVVPFKNSEAIYHSIMNILSDNSLRNRLIKNGQKSVRQFNIKDHIHQLERLYLS